MTTSPTSALKLLFLIFVLLTIALFIIQSQYITNFSQTRRILKWDGNDNISCHYDYSNDILPPAEDMVFGRESIFFHETSCRGGLNSRQACVIESAARLHTNRSVYVLFSASVTEENLQNSCLKELRKLNVEFFRIHLPKYAEGTGLEDILTNEIYNASGYRIEHSSDILRFITLYKYGGVYLDTDVLVVKQLDALGRNWAARQDASTVNNAVIAVANDGIGHKVIETVLEEIRKDYRPRSWSYNGPGALTRTLQKYCNNYTEIENFSAEKCEGFEVYKPNIMYPIPYPAFGILFEPGTISQYNESYGIHLWNRLSNTLNIEKGSLVHDLATKHCPSIVNYFVENFGL